MSFNDRGYFMKFELASSPPPTQNTFVLISPYIFKKMIHVYTLVSTHMTDFKPAEMPMLLCYKQRLVNIENKIAELHPLYKAMWPLFDEVEQKIKTLEAVKRKSKKIKEELVNLDMEKARLKVESDRYWHPLTELYIDSRYTRGVIMELEKQKKTL